MYRFAIFILVVAIIIAFFMPWFSVEQEELGSVARIVSGGGISFLKISGFKIPFFANGKNTKVILSIAKAFNPDIKDIEKKSWFVYIIPILAYLIYLTAKKLGKNRFINFIFALLGVSIFVIGSFKIKTVNLNKVLLDVKICKGVWVILAAYLGIGLLGLKRLTSSNIERKWR